MALPPSEAGADHDTTAEALPATADTAVGAPGGPVGVTPEDGDDGRPVPLVLVAVTVKVYRVPLVSPLTVQLVAGVGPLDVHPALEGVELTV